IREVDDSEIGDDKGGFATLGTHLSGVRGGADARMLPPADAYTFYNRLLDVFTQGTKVAERAAPDAVVASGVAEGLRVLNAAESMSRSNGLALSMVSTEGAAGIPLEEFTGQSGFYHNEVANVTAELTKAQRTALAALTSSSAWQQLGEMENAVA